MGRTMNVLVLAVWLQGCATVAVSPSFTTLQTILIQQEVNTSSDFAIPGQSHAAYLERLEGWARAQDIIVVSTSLRSRRVYGAVAHSAYVGWTLYVDAGQPANMRFYTCVHELAHIYEPKALRSSEEQDREAFAELTATQVARRLGLNTDPQTAAYLKYYVTREAAYRVVEQHGAAIDALVEKLARAAM